MANKDFKVKNGLDIQSPLPVSMGGTGQTSAENTLNALLPLQTDNAGKVLKTDGTNTSWVSQPTGYTVGNTSSRPGSPFLGQIYSNTQTGIIEVYTSAGWSAVAAPPQPPTIGTATNVGTSRAYNDGAATVTFTAATTGGLASSYTVTSSPGGYTATGSSSPITVTGLQSNTAYTFTVTGTNVYGTSAASSATSSITATTVPQAPTIGTPIPEYLAASIPFTANATGGSSITSYTVTSSPGSLTATGSSSPLSISGLTANTNYTFTVTATNANGTSAASSASSSIQPIFYESDFELITFSQPTSTSTVTFDNIPQTYKHLQIRMSVGNTTNSDTNIWARFNQDTGNNYGRTQMYTNGTTQTNNVTVTSGVDNLIIIGRAGSGSAINGVGICDILDYTSTSRTKPVRSTLGANVYTLHDAAVWNNTAAITRIDVTNPSSNFVTGSTVALYGVK